MPVEQQLGFRRLVNQGEVQLPDAVLNEGDKGDQVKAVQQALNMAGYEAGPSDGIYGPKTREAVKELQSTEDDLGIDGIYGPNTRNYLKDLLGG
jgi:peptidoglycan hydrolase-like protein with peptidoglycan-binding domain